jgi:S-adenosylmethionine decarboxylase
LAEEYGMNGINKHLNKVPRHMPSPLFELEYREISAWGLSTAIDLHDCDPQLVRSADAIKQFVVKLTDLIGVQRYGECMVVHFGDRPEIAGFSMTQLIETSLVSGHFVNETNDIYLDIFSCKYYDPHLAADFSQKYFKAKDKNVQVVLRK